MDSTEKEIQTTKTKTVITTQTIIQQIQKQESVSTKKTKDPSLINSIKSLASNFLTFGDNQDGSLDASHVSGDSSNAEWQRFNSYSDLLDTDEDVPASVNLMDEINVEQGPLSAALTVNSYYSAFEEASEQDRMSNENNENWIDYVRDKLDHESQDSSFTLDNEQETLVESVDIETVQVEFSPEYQITQFSSEYQITHLDESSQVQMETTVLDPDSLLNSSRSSSIASMEDDPFDENDSLKDVDSFNSLHENMENTDIVDHFTDNINSTKQVKKDTENNNYSMIKDGDVDAEPIDFFKTQVATVIDRVESPNLAALSDDNVSLINEDESSLVCIVKDPQMELELESESLFINNNPFSMDVIDSTEDSDGESNDDSNEDSNVRKEGYRKEENSYQTIKSLQQELNLYKQKLVELQKSLIIKEGVEQQVQTDEIEMIVDLRDLQETQLTLEAQESQQEFIRSVKLTKIIQSQIEYHTFERIKTIASKEMKQTDEMGTQMDIPEFNSYSIQVGSEMKDSFTNISLIESNEFSCQTEILSFHDVETETFNPSLRDVETETLTHSLMDSETETSTLAVKESQTGTDIPSFQETQTETDAPLLKNSETSTPLFKDSETETSTPLFKDSETETDTPSFKDSQTETKEVPSVSVKEMETETISVKEIKDLEYNKSSHVEKVETSDFSKQTGPSFSDRVDAFNYMTMLQYKEDFCQTNLPEFVYGSTQVESLLSTQNSYTFMEPLHVKSFESQTVGIVLSDGNAQTQVNETVDSATQQDLTFVESFTSTSDELSIQQDKQDKKDIKIERTETCIQVGSSLMDMIDSSCHTRITDSAETTTQTANEPKKSSETQVEFPNQDSFTSMNTPIMMSEEIQTVESIQSLNSNDFTCQTEAIFISDDLELQNMQFNVKNLVNPMESTTVEVKETKNKECNTEVMDIQKTGIDSCIQMGSSFGDLIDKSCHTPFIESRQDSTQTIDQECNSCFTQVELSLQDSSTMVSPIPLHVSSTQTTMSCYSDVLLQTEDLDVANQVVQIQELQNVNEKSVTKSVIMQDFECQMAPDLSHSMTEMPIITLNDQPTQITILCSETASQIVPKMHPSGTQYESTVMNTCVQYDLNSYSNVFTQYECIQDEDDLENDGVSDDELNLEKELYIKEDSVEDEIVLENMNNVKLQLSPTSLEGGTSLEEKSQSHEEETSLEEKSQSHEEETSLEEGIPLEGAKSIKVETDLSDWKEQGHTKTIKSIHKTTHEYTKEISYQEEIHSLELELKNIKSRLENSQSEIKQKSQVIDIYKNHLLELVSERDLLKSRLGEASTMTLHNSSRNAHSKAVEQYELKKYRSIPIMHHHEQEDKSNALSFLEGKIHSQSLEISNLELNLCGYRDWIQNLQKYARELERKLLIPSSNRWNYTPFIEKGGEYDIMSPTPILDHRTENVTDYVAVGDVVVKTQLQPQILDFKEKGWAFIDKRVSIQLLHKKKR